MSLIFATQLTAVATLALAVFALAAAILASLAFWKQSQEVRALLDDRERETAERRKAHASRVFAPAAQLPGIKYIPAAVNAGNYPIYDTQIWRYDAPGLSGGGLAGTQHAVTAATQCGRGPPTGAVWSGYDSASTG